MAFKLTEKVIMELQDRAQEARDKRASEWCDVALGRVPCLPEEKADARLLCRKAIEEVYGDPVQDWPPGIAEDEGGDDEGEEV